jgi:hypothetical protein
MEQKEGLRNRGGEKVKRRIRHARREREGGSEEGVLFSSPPAVVIMVIIGIAVYASFLSPLTTGLRLARLSSG